MALFCFNGILMEFFNRPILDILYTYLYTKKIMKMEEPFWKCAVVVQINTIVLQVCCTRACTSALEFCYRCPRWFNVGVMKITSPMNSTERCVTIVSGFSIFVTIPTTISLGNKNKGNA